VPHVSEHGDHSVQQVHDDDAGFVSDKGLANVMITNFSDVRQFSAKKLAFFFKKNSVAVLFLQNLAAKN
jgi:hypothetical protein